MFIEKIKKEIAKRNILSYLHSDANKINQASLKEILPAFQSAAEKVAAYKTILEEKKVDSKTIKNLEDFKNKVPILKKEDLFGRFSIDGLFADGKVPEEIVAAFTSSGFSKVYSYGIVSKKDANKQKILADILLDIFFNLDKKKAVLINALPMGVQFFTSYPIVSTSVKTGMVVSFLKLFGEKFNSAIIFTDPYFAKKIIEEGIEEGIDWKDENVSFVIGGQWFSNSLINYLKTKACILEDKKIMATMGMSEIGLNIFNDSPVLQKIRDLSQKDKSLRKDLFGDIKTSPEIMYCYPYKVFSEITNKDKNGFGEIVLTTIGSDMPLIRYNSKDTGKLFGSDDFKNILKKHNCNLVPEFNLPVMGIYGREDSITFKGVEIFPQDVEEALFQDERIAEKITGCFKINKSSKTIEVQLVKNAKFDRILARHIQKRMDEFLEVSIPIKVYEYQSFPYSMELDYESKFRFI